MKLLEIQESRISEEFKDFSEKEAFLINNKKIGYTIACDTYETIINGKIKFIPY